MSELSYEAKALIRRAGTADGPSRADRARVKRRIVAGIAAAGTTLAGGGTVASGAPAALGAVSAGKMTVASVLLWLAAGAGLGSVVSVPAVVSTYRRAEAVRTAVPATAPLSAPAAVRPPIEPASDPLRAAAAPITEKTERNERISEHRDPGRSRAAAATGAASLAEETRLLEAAQRELAKNQGGAALAMLDEHAARFPSGALSEERSAARILALCGVGRTGEARSAAKAFIAASPSSPLVPRLESSCASSEPGATVNAE